MKTLVLTIAIGDEYTRLASVTHPSLRAYADRIGADFTVITTPKIAQTTPHWEKCQLREYLDVYDRVMYLDTDILVRADCPNLFDLVPVECVGAFNEAQFTYRSREMMVDVCKAYGVTLPSWDGRYFNTGVLVLSRAHAPLFHKPAYEHYSFYEQSYLNMVFALFQVPVYPLPYQYNRMTCMDAVTGEHRLASYIVHYAGAPSIDQVIQVARTDALEWQGTGTLGINQSCRARRHVHVQVTGGLGDQVNAEPALRYMLTHVYPASTTHVTISSHWPILFRHLVDLGATVGHHNDFVPEPDTAYYTCDSLPGPDTVTWSVVSNLLCHTVDYCAMALLRRLLPMDQKRVILRTTDEDAALLQQHIGDEDLSRYVVIHAGQHWKTKTFPVAWWQTLLDELGRRHIPVCLIGQDDVTTEPDDPRGVLPVTCPPGGLDLRNRLSLPQVMVALSRAPLLVSNDSAPVHIAGAFDQHILVIPTCKHPEHVLPYRHGSVWWRGEAMYRRLVLDEVSAQPTEVYGTLAEFPIADWEHYLPDPLAVCDRVEEILWH